MCASAWLRAERRQRSRQRWIEKYSRKQTQQHGSREGGSDATSTRRKHSDRQLQCLPFLAKEWSPSFWPCKENEWKCAIRTGKTHIGRKEEKQEKRARARKKRQRREVDVARPESTHVAPELWSSFGWSYMDTALRGCQKGSANCFFMHTSLALFFFIFFFPSANGAQLRLGVCFDFHLSFFFFLVSSRRSAAENTANILMSPRSRLTISDPWVCK